MKTTFSYPKWAEIPNIDLYLDQVLLYVNQVCSPISPDKDKGPDSIHGQQLCETWLPNKA